MLRESGEVYGVKSDNYVIVWSAEIGYRDAKQFIDEINERGNSEQRIFEEVLEFVELYECM
jgi:hypothetical protein